MALPSKSRSFDPRPDANGWNYAEDFGAANPSFYVRPLSSDGVNGSLARPAPFDDPTMGRVLRLSTWPNFPTSPPAGPGVPTDSTRYGDNSRSFIAPVWLDHRKPAKVQFTMRLTYPAGWNAPTDPSNNRNVDGAFWDGLGILYGGEGSYDGMDFNPPAPGTLVTPNNRLGMYGTPFSRAGGGATYPELNDWASGLVRQVQIEWWPRGAPDTAATLPPSGVNGEGIAVLRARFSSDGGVTWTTWVRGPQSGWHENSTGLIALASAALLWPFSLYTIQWGFACIDLASVRMSGAPMWGAVADVGWVEDWDLSAVTINYIDDTLYGHTGGIVIAPGGRATGALLPIPANVTPARLRLINAYGSAGGRADVRLYTADGALVPDSLVPGNSTGLAGAARLNGAFISGSQAPAVAGDGTFTVDLSAIPAGTSLYAEATPGANGNSLGGVFIEYSVPPPGQSASAAAASAIGIGQAGTPAVGVTQPGSASASVAAAPAAGLGTPGQPSAQASGQGFVIEVCTGPGVFVPTVLSIT